MPDCILEKIFVTVKYNQALLELHHGDICIMATLNIYSQPPYYILYTILHTFHTVLFYFTPFCTQFYTILLYFSIHTYLKCTILHYCKISSILHSLKRMSVFHLKQCKMIIFFIICVIMQPQIIDS